MRNGLFLIAAVADLVGVYVHGLLGHRAVISPLFPDRLFETPAFGDRDLTGRIFMVSWHVVTAFFFCSSVALALLGFGLIEGVWLPRFIGSAHASFALVGLSVVGPRLPVALRRPIPIVFVSVMCTVATLGWLG